MGGAGQHKQNKKHAGSENHSPHLLRKRSQFNTRYHKASPPRRPKVWMINGDQEGCRLDLKLSPEI